MKGASGADDRQGRYLCTGCPAHVEWLRVLLEAWAELPESVKAAAGGAGQGLVLYRAVRQGLPQFG